MIVTTDFPCGNGRIHWYTPKHFEIEVIAYSKSPRYTTFKIFGVREDERREIIIRPDRLSPDDFSPLDAKVWMRKGEEGEWEALSEEQVGFYPDAIRFTLDFKKGEEIYFSTEPPREYQKTTQELFDLATKHPETCRIHCIGFSIEHRPIFALRITAPENRTQAGQELVPVINIHAGEHASEFSGEEMVRGMLSLVVDERPESVALRRAFVFDFILNVNPDGNYHGWHQYNARDWREHNYATVVDRSWHHEFDNYFSGVEGVYSPETRAMAEWLILTRPTFVFSAHSWLGHKGNPGAFHASREVLSEDFGFKMDCLNALAKQGAAKFDLEFETYPSSNLCAGHLGTYLMKSDLCLAYTIEGHMNPGRETLQSLGAILLDLCLNSPSLRLNESRAPHWDAWKAVR